MSEKMKGNKTVPFVITRKMRWCCGVVLLLFLSVTGCFLDGTDGDPCAAAGGSSIGVDSCEYSCAAGGNGTCPADWECNINGECEHTTIESCTRCPDGA